MSDTLERLVASVSLKRDRILRIHVPNSPDLPTLVRLNVVSRSVPVHFGSIALDMEQLDALITALREARAALAGRVA